MISRFPRRSVCLLLALVTLCLCLSPALVQPAQAVAGFDDATLAVGLLFMSWAGVTFATSQGAYTATSNFLQSSVNGLKAASHVAANYVVDGTLKLCQGVKDAFASFLPEVNATFQTPSGSLQGSLGAGAFSIPGVYHFDVPYYDVEDVNSLRCINPDSYPDFYMSYAGVTYHFVRRNSRVWDIYGGSGSHSLTTYDGKDICFIHCKTGSQPNSIYYLYAITSGWNQQTNFLGNSAPYSAIPPVFSVSSPDSDPVTFQRSKEIDGTQVQEITFVPGGVWESDPSDPERPKPDMSQWPGLSLALLLSMLNNPGSDDPNLDPEQMIEELKKALNGTSGGGSGGDVTTPVPDPPGGGSGDTDVPAGSAPSFNQMMLPGLKDFFPFCIPFDIYAMMQALCADPVAPSFTFGFSVLGKPYSVNINLSAWDNVAATVRSLVVVLYIASLALATRKFIKW